MAKQNIDIGVEGNDATGDSIRESFRKVNENFDELYAVFGLGGQISFLDLNDTPTSYENNAQKIPVINDTETGLSFLQLASDNALNPDDVDSIGFDFSEEGKLIVRIVSTNISRDIFPTLGGPLNAAIQPIANIAPINQDSVDVWRATHQENIEVGDLVINKRYGDANYQEKQRAGGGIRLLPEPVSADQYTKLIDSFDSFGNPVIASHGLSDAFLGAPFVFNTTTASEPPSNIVDGQTVYVRIIDDNTISLHTSEEAAINNTNRIVLSGGADGILTLVDADYDDTLDGNWLSTVALPRESVTRRQGDRMEGALFLHDHPGDLAGLGTDIGGSDDLQAATKLYVDKGTPTSQVNLYVSTSGDDKQTFTPAGKEGRSESWAYRTLNAAARKAEEIIESSPFETGPYRQTITYNNGSNDATITSAGVSAPPVGRVNYTTLISENKEFIQKEVTAFIAATFPNFEYDIEICERDIGYIVDSVRLDILLGDNANYLSRWSGIRYYSNPSARKAIGEQLTETVAGIEHAKKLVRDIVKNIQVGSSTSIAGQLYQDRVEQFRDATLITSQFEAENVANATDAKFDIITDIIDLGPLDAPTIVDGSTTYKINMFNGNSGFVDQGNPSNTDIIPGKVVIGKSSGAVARIISYTYESDPSTTTPVSNDVLELQLLEPIEFDDGEELEYGNIVRETQVTIRMESGIYEEDYPIRVAPNVSIKGDEFRRVIIRPKQRVSQSRYATTFFYRDTTFDGLTIVRSRIVSLSDISNGEANVTRAAAVGTYTGVSPDTVTIVDPITGGVTVSDATSGNGENATFDITVNADGSVTLDDIDINDPGTGFVVGETITINDVDIGNTGADNLVLTVGEISGGKEYVNPLNGNIDGYFGYHYLLDPDRLPSTGDGYINEGGRTTAAQIVKDNKEFMQEQVLEYLAVNYPAVSFDQSKCSRDIGLIIDAIANDYDEGGNEKVLEAQGEYYYGALPKDGSQTAATIAGIDYIYEMASLIMQNAQPAVIYGTGLEYPQADLFNGEAEAGSITLLRNFVDTVLFAFDEDYNPPLRNDEMDVFLMNDATILRNLTVQGHGGFLCVLDPEGQVLTKSPYIQTGSSFSRSLNKQVFAGGMMVDAFAGNSAVQVVATGRPADGSPVPDTGATPDPFVLQVQSLGSPEDPQGLFVRRPETPAPFYVDGRRFQVNAVINYDPGEGTAVLLLDKNSNDGQGFTGVTSTLTTGVDLDDFSSPIPVTIQTAGNRSMLGNDFTQVNDLGYGLVVLNGGLSEMVSMFTYYCWTSYYSKNGSEIRSLTGSSCYGEYGLVAEGSDPNEIPDSVSLVDDMARPAKIFNADIIITTSGTVSLGAGDEITQAGTGATGTVTTSINGRTINLIDITGTFNTSDTLSITTDSTPVALGANSIPEQIDATGFSNDEEQLFAHIYDLKESPSNRGEFDIYHPITDIFARYEIANTSDTGITVGEVSGFGDTISYTYNPIAAGTGTGATFTVNKTIVFGYNVESILIGEDYEVGDEIVLSGTDLGGLTPTNDLTITVDEVDSNGGITDFSISGDIFINGDTPYYNGKVYRVNFATGDAQFSQDGILETGGIVHDTPVQLRNNQTFLLDDIARPDILTIRPSTAVVFRENQNTVYRSISFSGSDSIGNELPIDRSLAGFDSSYDYIRLVVNASKASETVQNVYDTDGITKISSNVETKGGTKGDQVIAVSRIYEENEVKRLNNNTLTDALFRPDDFDSGELPMITSWFGRKHRIFNYKGVKDTLVSADISNATQANPVVITLAEDINLESGEQVTISDITAGMTELNGTYYFSPTTGTSGELYTDAGLTSSVDGTGFTAYTTGGSATVTREVVQFIPSETDDYGIVSIDTLEDIYGELNDYDGIRAPVIQGDENIVLRAGLQSGSPATVTINISTCRATGHDFLDVGTGGFNTSNYPNVIFGLPRQPNQANEVEERTKGRVFYVSTDQNGIFRVGRFFSVDQGTGTVSFSASIALSDVDGLGFKRGVVVTEFSTDTAMTDNASDTVPTESAVRGYVNRRLGFDQTGAAISNKIGPGVLAPNGSVPMTADLNADNNTITNIGIPTAPSDAATKAYVDNSRGDNDNFTDLRDTDINDIQEGQLLVATNLKKLVIDADLIVTSGPSSAYIPGQTITGNVSGATGTIVDTVQTVGFEGNIIIITYEPISGTFSSGDPVGQDTISVSGVIEGPAVDGPIDEFVNGVYSADSDIEISTNRVVTTDPITGEATDRYTEVSVQLKSQSIDNADIESNAQIAQSKLAMNKAATLSSATGITQSDLGLAAFNESEFTTTDGYVEFKTATGITDGISPNKLQHISTDTVLGRSAAGDGAVSAIPFSTVVNEGGGLADADFEAASELAFTDDPGEALIKTGIGTYGISNVTTQGEPNSIVKTDASGSIQVNSLILGGDSNYEILSLNTTELEIKTPAQGTVLTSSGGSPGTGGSPSDPGYIAPTFPDLEIPGNVNIGGTGVTESSLQGSSPLNGESGLAVDWIYSSFIEAPGEKGLASTGIAIGANTSKSTAGQVAIVTASGTTTSAVPFLFSDSGAVPDNPNIYNIGSPSLRYNTMYATVFNGTATEALYADLAENYTADTNYEPGTVLVFGGNEEVTLSTRRGDQKVAGVVSTNPAYLMNSHQQGDCVVAVALQGRVPCKVIGKVSKGDMLVTSAIPGYAIVDNDPKLGSVIGKALTEKTTDERGIVEVVVGRL